MALGRTCRSLRRRSLQHFFLGVGGQFVNTLPALRLVRGHQSGSRGRGAASPEGIQEDEGISGILFEHSALSDFIVPESLTDREGGSGSVTTEHSLMGSSDERIHMSNVLLIGFALQWQQGNLTSLPLTLLFGRIEEHLGDLLWSGSVMPGMVRRERDGGGAGQNQLLAIALKGEACLSRLNPLAAVRRATSVAGNDITEGTTTSGRRGNEGVDDGGVGGEEGLRVFCGARMCEDAWQVLSTISSLKAIVLTDTNLRFTDDQSAQSHLQPHTSVYYAPPARALQPRPQLSSLCLVNCGIKSLFMLQQYPSLREVNASRNPLSSEGLSGIETLPALEMLNISSTSVTSVIILKSCPRLRELKVECLTGLSAPSLEALIRDGGIRTLTSVVASSVTLAWGDSWTEVFRSPRRPFPQVGAAAAALRNIAVSRTEVATIGQGGDPFLESLDVSDSHFTEESITGMFDCLATLNVRNCRMSSLMTVAVYCPALRSLEASALSRLENDGLAGIANLPSLTTLSLRGCRRVTAVGVYLSGCPTLTSLNLSETGVTAEGLLGVERVRSLTELSLQRCPIETVAFLGEGNCPRLTKLDLRGTRVSSAGLSGLGRMRTLEELHLSDCTRVDSLASLLLVPAADPPACQGLRVLSLARSAITDDGLRGLRHLPQLWDLNLAGCAGLTTCEEFAPSTTSRGAMVAPDCPATLTSLDVTRCVRLTSDAVRRIAALRSSLHELHT